MPPDLHIVHGDAAATLIRPLIKAPGTLFADHDQLSHGPLRPFESLDGWRKLRAAYHDTVMHEASEAPFKNGPSLDVLLNAERLRDADTITVWVGTGLVDQLLLAWTTALLPHLDVDPDRLRVVQFHRAEDGWETLGIGVLNFEQAAAHPPPMTMTAVYLDELHEAWRAASAETPDALLAFLVGPHLPVTLLRRSFHALPGFYPDLRTGLNVWELELLRNADAQGPSAVSV